MSFKSRSFVKSTVSMKQLIYPYASATATATATAISTGNDSVNTLIKSKKIASDLAITDATIIASNSVNTDSNEMVTSQTATTGVSITTTTNAIPWSTDSTKLQYYTGSANSTNNKTNKSSGNYTDYLIKGVSLTSTEYAGSIFASSGYYDFGYYTYNDSTDTYYTYYQNGSETSNGNSGLTLNVYYLMQNVILQLLNVKNVAPQIRIPVCADYWLNGTANTPAVNSYTYPYFTNGQTNVTFTSAEYQQSIIDIIYYCYSTWTDNTTTPTDNTTTPITFTIDLHWNYAAQQPETSGSYPSTAMGYPEYGYSTLSSKQLPMPGVAVNDMSGNGLLSLTDNTVAFWNSVASLFGVNSDGNAIGTPSAYTYSGGSPSSYFTKSTTTTDLPVSLLQNIMFELYNEPFTDQLIYPNGGTSYSNNYSYYVNGGDSVMWNGNNYNFTGFGQMYNTIRQTIGAQNVCIIAGSDNYAYMLFNTTSENGQWDTSANSINTNTYNCFTTLRDNITDGKISNPAGGFFSAYNFYNVLNNFHTYVGLYSGAFKHAGYYDASYYSTTPNNTTTTGSAIPGFAQIITALQTPNTPFYVGCPNICTEYGGYDLPWSTYSSSTPSTDSTSYQYSSDYFDLSNNTVSLVGINNYGTPYYNGNYVDASGNSTAMPGIIGYLNDFINLNVSFCLWGFRPNSGGNGAILSSDTANSWLISDNNPYYYSWNSDTNAWAAFQPDAICGSANAYINFQTDNETATTEPDVTPTTLPSSNLYFTLITSTNQDLSDTTINYGANGADFQYIFDNFYKV